jgi:hypothetical protein
MRTAQCWWFVPIRNRRRRVARTSENCVKPKFAEFFLPHIRVNKGWGSSEVGAQGKGDVTVIDAGFNVVDIGTLPC